MGIVVASQDITENQQGLSSHLTVVKLTCNKNKVQTYSSWHASTQSQEDHHGPHNYILLHAALPCQRPNCMLGTLVSIRGRMSWFIRHECHKTFSATTGTVFYRLRTSTETVVIIVTLLAQPWVSPAAIVAAFDERTVAA